MLKAEVRPTAQYGFSEKVLKRHKEKSITIALYLSVAVFIVLFYYDMKITMDLRNWVIFCCFAGITGGVLLFLNRLYYRNFLNHRVLLSKEGIIKMDGYRAERLEYKHILGVRIHEESSGEILGLSFFTKVGFVHLYGFKNMNELLQRLKPYIHELAVVERRRSFLHASSRWSLHGSLLLASAAGFWLLGQVGEIFPSWPFYITLFLSLRLIFSRPVSHLYGYGYRRLELMLAIALLLGCWIIGIIA